MRTWIKSILVVLLSAGVIWAAGAYAPYGYRYIPQLTTQGTTDYNQIVINETATDALLHTLDLGFGVINTKAALYKTLGDVGYETLSAAVTSAGVVKTTLFIPAGAWAAGGVIVPATMTLNVQHGGYFTVGNGETLTINGPIEAGPYQIFSWTGSGAIDISGSPTIDCPIEWWGGVAGTSNDCYAAIVKAAGSISSIANNSPHWLVFSNGRYRIASPLTLSVSGVGFGIKGSNPYGSSIYIDVGTSYDGITLAGAAFPIRDITFNGPSNCCKNGVVCGIDNNAGGVDMDNVHFFMGATEYALRFQGTVTKHFNNIDIGNYFGPYPAGGIDYGCDRPVNGIGFFHPPSVEFGNNVIQFNAISISGLSGICIYAENAIDVSFNSGAIQGGAGSTGIYIDGFANELTHSKRWVQRLIFRDFYFESGAGSTDLVLKNADQVELYDFTELGGQTVLTNAQDCYLKGGAIDDLTIEASCANTRLDGITVGTGGSPNLSDSLKDYSTSTIYITPVNVGYATDGYGHQKSSPSQAANILDNSDLSRWASSTVPDGWTLDNTSATKCGTGIIADTTNHNTPYCAKITTTAASGSIYFRPSPASLLRIIGKTVTFSIWAKASDTPASFPYPIIAYTVGDWANTTKYNVGDVVQNTGHTLKLIMVAAPDGTSGGTEPDWSTLVLYGDTLTDGTCTWQKIIGSSNGEQVMVAGDVGHWRQLSTSVYIPANATDAYVMWPWSQKAGGTNIDCYISEPCLSFGGWSPNFYLPSTNYASNSFTLLNTGVTATPVDDPLVTANSKITLTATSANAAAAMGSATGVYISAKTAGQFTVTHPATPGASATMDYMVIN